METTVDSLGNDPAVAKVLGATHAVRGSSAVQFYKDIKVYIDSKEKLTIAQDPEANESGGDGPDVSRLQDGDENGGNNHEQPVSKERQVELWPLIKVVKIQTKADILSTGAVIVDLVSPGLFFSVNGRTYAYYQPSLVWRTRTLLARL